MTVESARRMSALVLFASLAVAGHARTAHAWAIGSQFDNDGCHEPMTAEALRRVRAELDTAPVLKPSRDEAAMIADVLFTPPSDVVTDLAGMTLMLGVRDNDVKDINPLSSLDLIQVHGSPDTQHEHCIRASGDDDDAGNQAALEKCRAFILEKATEALDGLDADGRVDPSKRARLTFFVAIAGEIEPALPLFYLRMGAAMHALEDAFPHTYRTADGMTVTVVLNWIDLINGTHDEARDGPPHRAELDRCWENDPTIHRNYDIATRAATELLHVALDPTLGRDQKIQQFDVVTARYLGYQPGCTFENDWCDPPEASVTNTLTGCNAGAESSLAWSALALAGLAIVWHRRRVSGVAIGSALIVIALLAAPARAEDPPSPEPTTPPATTPADEEPGVPTPATDPAPKDGAEPGRDVKTPTVKEVADVRADKQLGNRWGFAGSFGGSIDRPAVVTSAGGRYRITERWIVGLDAGWNPWVTTSPMKVRAGVFTMAGTVIRRFPMRFDRVNLRTSFHLGTSTLLFDVYGAPKYSTGPYVALSPLGIDYDLGHAVRIVWDPMEMALAMPLVGQLPLYYEQFRFMIGIQIGG